MNLAINFKFLIHIFIIALIAKALTLPLYFYLPHFGVEQSRDFSINLYRRFHISKAFGILPSKKIDLKDENKPLYKLTNVKLKALYSMGNGKGVIAIEEKDSLIFLSVGEMFKGYKLIEVKPDGAIFEKNSKHFELKVEDDLLKGKYLISQENIDPEDVKFAVLKRDILRYKRHFSDIWKNIAIEEIIDPKTKKLKGFRVERINKNSIFAKVGLQKGDIIIGANNQIFKSYSDVFKIYNNIDKYNSIKITVLRNNEKKELEYEIY
jgi:general secretion pathway protein C